MDAQAPVVVARVTQPAAAEIIRNMLQAEGIACEVSGQNQAGLSAVLEIEVLVRAIDADRAERLIRRHEEGDHTRDQHSRPEPGPAKRLH